MKTLLLASLILTSSVSFADSVTTQSSNISADISNGPGLMGYYKQDVKLMVPEAIQVLEGVPASDEFIALKEALEKSGKRDLTDADVAKLIISVATQK